MKTNCHKFTADPDWETNSLSVTNENRTHVEPEKIIRFIPAEIAVVSMHEKFIRDIMRTIELNISNPNFCTSMLAGENAMSSVQLYRRLKKLTGRTPNEIIRTFRLARAASLLNQEAGHVATIAYSVGFRNLSYFTKCFREAYGTCPTRFTCSSIEFRLIVKQN